MKLTFKPAQDTIQNTLIKVIVVATFLTTLLIGAIFVFHNFQNKNEYINMYETQLLEDAKTELKEKTIMLWHCIDKIHDRELHGEFTREQAIEQVRNLLRDARYDNGNGYYFCDTFDGTNLVLLGNKDVEGKNRINVKDSEGKEFMKEVISNGRKEGGGYTHMTFPKHNSTEFYPKLNYSVSYEPYEIVFGTGIYIDFIEAKVAEQIEIADNQINKEIIIICVVMMFTTIISYIVAVNISKAIVSPILDICNKMSTMSSGDFKQTIEYSNYANESEIGVMYKSLEILQEEVAMLISSIADSAQQVAAASEQLLASSEQSAIVSATVADSAVNVAGSCTQQFESVESSTASANEMQIKMNDCNNILDTTIDSINSTHSMANSGKKKANEAMNQMNIIKDSVDSSSKVIKVLEDKSVEISGITEVISNIAEQTNLLALNAAIEAARAGEHGRGFSVVAEEVRKLAEQSREASGQISDIVNSVRIDTDKAVKIMEENTKRVESGSVIVNESSRLFEKIADTIDTIVSNSKKLADNVKALESSSVSINNNIEEVNAMSRNISSESQTVSASTEELTASMHEIAKSSDSLAQMATNLQTKIEKFKY